MKTPAPAQPKSSSPCGEPPTILPPPPPAPGRPTLQTPEVTSAICAAIRLHGCSDSAAGLLAGVSTSTLSRWKQDDEDFQVSIGQARAQFDVERLTQIRESCKRDGTPDWRAHAWLLRNSSPQTYGPPARRRRPTAAEPKPQDPNAITSAQLAALQETRLRAHEAAQASHANMANLPEIPAGLEPMSPTEPLPEQAPGANCANLPEITAEASCRDHTGPISPMPPPASPAPHAKCANIPKTPARPSLLKTAFAKVAAKLHPAPARDASVEAARERAARRQAEEAEEFRRIHEAMNREWERQTDAPDEEWKKDVIPGMWAGLY